MRVESSLQLVLNVRLPARTRGRRLRAELEAWHVEPWMARGRPRSQSSSNHKPPPLAHVALWSVDTSPRSTSRGPEATTAI